MLERTIANSHSVCLSVRLSVTFVTYAKLNGLRYRNIFYSIRKSDLLVSWRQLLDSGPLFQRSAIPNIRYPNPNPKP